MLHFDVKEHIVPAYHIREYPGSTVNNQEDILNLHVKQYIPKSRNVQPGIEKDPITFIATHGVGLPKSCTSGLRPMAFPFVGIWIADVASLGYSGVLNEKQHSNDVSWMDHARDLLLLINHFRDQMLRPLVGVGHSFGGCQIADLAYLHPRLFTTLLLLEPVIQLGAPPIGFGTDGPGTINFTVHRKDIWPNRAAAAASISPLLKEWDPRVKDRMIQHSFRSLPTALYPDLPPDANPEDPPVTLRTTKYQDSLTQLRENFEAHQRDGRIVIDRQTHADMDALAAFVPLYQPEPRAAFYRLPSLRPSALWVFGDRTYLNLDEMRETHGHRNWRIRRRSRGACKRGIDSGPQSSISIFGGETDSGCMFTVTLNRNDKLS